MSDDAPGRRLIFIRHGQYQREPELLTALGRRQARATARFLKSGPAPTRLYASDMPRADETARLIAEALGMEPKTDEALREILPTSIPGARVPLAARAQGKAALATIEARYFKGESGLQVFVAHGNLIRSLLHFALDLRLTGWSRLRSFHCGLTCFRVRDGGVALEQYNAVGHLPPELVTES